MQKQNLVDLVGFACDATVVLLAGVRNASNILNILKNNLDDDDNHPLLKVTFVRAAMVVDVLPLFTAAASAVVSQAQKSMTAATLNMELLYCFSAEKSISDAIRSVGMKPNDENVVLVFVDANDEEIEKALSFIEYKQIQPLSHLSQLQDVKAIKKLYKISQNIENHDDIVNSVAFAIAAKSC